MMGNDSPDEQDDTQDYYDYSSDDASDDQESDNTGSLYSAEETTSEAENDSSAANLTNPRAREGDENPPRPPIEPMALGFHKSALNSSNSRIPVPSRLQIVQNSGQKSNSLKEHGHGQPSRPTDDHPEPPIIANVNQHSTCMIAMSDPSETLYFGAGSISPDLVSTIDTVLIENQPIIGRETNLSTSRGASEQQKAIPDLQKEQSNQHEVVPNLQKEAANQQKEVSDLQREASRSSEASNLQKDELNEQTDVPNVQKDASKPQEVVKNQQKETTEHSNWENQEAQTDNIECSKDGEEARTFIAVLQTANDEKQSLIEQLQQDLRALNEAALNDRREIEEFNKMFQELGQQNEEEQSKRLEHEKTLVSNINSLKAKLCIEATERERYQLMLANASRDKQALEAEKKKLQDYVHELNLKIQTLEQERERAERLQDECNQKEHELADLKRYCQSLQSRIDSNNMQEQELNKRIMELCADASKSEMAMRKLVESNRTEKERRAALYKIISDFSTSIGIPVEADDLASSADKEKTESSQLMSIVFSDFCQLIASKDVDLEKHKQEIEMLQNLRREQQEVIKQLYESVNEQNASICKRSPSSENKIRDDEDENKKDGIVTEKNTTAILEELYRKQEAQRSSLLKMESQLRTLQSVHSHCGMRRTLQEARIGELETMMASFLD